MVTLDQLRQNNYVTNDTPSGYKLIGIRNRTLMDTCNSRPSSSWRTTVSRCVGRVLVNFVRPIYSNFEGKIRKYYLLVLSRRISLQSVSTPPEFDRALVRVRFVRAFQPTEYYRIWKDTGEVFFLLKSTFSSAWHSTLLFDSSLRRSTRATADFPAPADVSMWRH